ncbi:hypothetical protein FAES_3242 [Fibrella aestuarina BUZ 2]|uniref:Uncharacterized protein n=1 Tax=Fibrella aestuarina BUZ 2 TaxID=1166018 RepID=I0KAU8_9BACT|nr:hypothetical protein [Fibrella aestuarina]CCH01251.1 hypothetical protein FAES_3242 [Fibrella aestuarina BUZ 2]
MATLKPYTTAKLVERIDELARAKAAQLGAAMQVAEPTAAIDAELYRLLLLREAAQWASPGQVSQTLYTLTSQTTPAYVPV